MPKSNTETLRHLILKHGGLQELSANDPPSNTEHAERVVSFFCTRDLLLFSRASSVLSCLLTLAVAYDHHFVMSLFIAEAAVYLTMFFGNHVCSTAGSDSHDCHFRIVRQSLRDSMIVTSVFLHPM